MKKNYTTVTVALGERSYPIYIGKNLLVSSGELLAQLHFPKQLVVITDTTVASLYLAPLRKSLERSGFTILSIIIPSGEKQKSITRANAIYTELLRHRIGRNSAVVALGGGVIGDLAGFVAATYQRGLRFAQIPTTLLAQVDSSVGGKVGINHPLGKNMIGAFFQPECVIADIETLQTLPQREIVCGLGEVVKYGIIMKKDFFDFTARSINQVLQKNLTVLSSIVAECCSMKAYVVSNDEREQGLRAILNFGHTVGHALEKAGNYRVFKHGEAILLGMVAEAYIARELGSLSSQHFATIEQTIFSIPLPAKKTFSISASALLPTMRVDKKNKDGKIRLVLPTKIGHVNLPEAVLESLIIKSIVYLKKFTNRS